MDKRLAAMAWMAVLLTVGGMALAGDVTFADKPKITKVGDGAKVEFAVSAPIDADVAVLAADGSVVRHLASGLLGANAPAPFKKDSLRQELLWDGKDDFDKPVAGATFQIRVRLGQGAELDRFIPSASDPLGNARAIGVGPNGDVYVLAVRSVPNGQSTYFFVLDRNGKYLRTILPSPANLKTEQVKGLERLKLPGGKEVPIIYQGYTGDTAPFLSGMRAQQLAVTSQGWIAFASGGSDMWDQAVQRFVLTIKPDGSTPPEVGFVGPRLGNPCPYGLGLRQQQLAVSPDGKTIYFCGMGNSEYGKHPVSDIHCIGRTTWDSKAPAPEAFIGKPSEAGDDGAHLNDPMSVACDAQGRILVSDFGNGRVAVFAADGKFLGQTKVERPGMVCVHPKTGALYVLTVPLLEGKKTKDGAFSVIKFDKAIDGKELTRSAFHGDYPVLALDASTETTRLWLANVGLFPLDDAGGKLEAGADVLKAPASALNGYPIYLALDRARDLLYVSNFCSPAGYVFMLRIDLKTEKMEPFLKQPIGEVALDRDGNVYTLDRSSAVTRYSPDGKPLPFATGSNKLAINYRAGLPFAGVKGLAIAPSGDVFAYQDNNTTAPMHAWQFGADGRIKKENIIKDIPFDSATGLAVDRAGNIYAGINIHDPKHLYPSDFGDQIPPLAWYTSHDPKDGWYGKPQRGLPVGAPWNRPYFNFYLYQYGSIFKFGPEGGVIYNSGEPKVGDNPRPADVPADAKEYRNAYFSAVVWLAGAKWEYRGFGLCANRTENCGDPGCSCMSSRFCMDESERLFVPDVFRCSIGVVDTAGNEITRFGAYGNVDSAGPKSLIPEPSIPFTSPTAVVVGKDKAYVADRKSRRIAVINLKWAAQETCELRKP